MNARDLILLQDMLDAAHKIAAYVHGKARADLESDDELLGFAIVKAIEIVGEAANHVSDETRAQFPSVEWGNIIGMRNRLIHAYSAINYDVVWDVAVNNVPMLVVELEKLLASAADTDET